MPESDAERLTTLDQGWYHSFITRGDEHVIGRASYAQNKLSRRFGVEILKILNSNSHVAYGTND